MGKYINIYDIMIPMKQWYNSNSLYCWKRSCTTNRDVKKKTIKEYETQIHDLSSSNRKSVVFSNLGAEPQINLILINRIPSDGLFNLRPHLFHSLLGCVSHLLCRMPVDSLKRTKSIDRWICVESKGLIERRWEDRTHIYSYYLDKWRIKWNNTNTHTEWK